MSILRVLPKKTKMIFTLAIQPQHYLVISLITFLKIEQNKVGRAKATTRAEDNFISHQLE